MHRILPLFVAALAAFLAAGSSVFAGTFTLLSPDGTTPPFTDWSRGDANSYYAEWDIFTDGDGATAGVQDTDGADIGQFPDSPALSPTPTVVENTGTSFLTGGGNIYSFAAATDFTVTTPNLGLGIGWNTRYVVQISALGNPLDTDSLKLTYHDGVDDVEVGYALLWEVGSTPSGGPGGTSVHNLFVFDIVGYNPASFTLSFNAAASSMSLDQLAIDTYTSEQALGALASAPTPTAASAGLLAFAASAAARRRRRRNPTHHTDRAAAL